MGSSCLPIQPFLQSECYKSESASRSILAMYFSFHLTLETSELAPDLILSSQALLHC